MLAILAALLLAWGCSSGSANGPGNMGGAPSVPVLVTDTTSAQTYKEYSAALEGRVNVEIRAQVDGYLDKIFVDEGAFVKEGQPLFKINDQPYREQLNNAMAAQQAAEANLLNAELEVNKMKVLSRNNVVSEIQLKTVEAAYEAAKANVAQSKAAVAMARINLDYTLIKAPVSGYIGRIPKRLGNLVGRMDVQALTTLSDVHEVYAYFSMSEMDFIAFNRDNKGEDIPEKIKNLLPVTLVLADGNLYPEQGRIEMVDGQFDKTTGSISLRANFPNKNGMLRSGNTGKVRLNQVHQGVLMIPQEATFELQDRTFVYVLGDSNKVKMTPITIGGKHENAYLVSEGLNPGSKIVTGSLHLLQDGAEISPVPAKAAGK
ncbi:MAG: efflux RND transporter periplasmic adaptor subunit [Flavobacteriales bacterium]